MKKILLYGAGAANLGIIAWFWWQGAGVLFAYGFPNILIALGRLSGLLLAYFVLQQFLFMSRAPWLERAFGMDKLSRVHRWTGYAVLALLIAHAGLLVWGYARAAEVSLWAQFADFILHYDDVLWAFIAAVFLLAVVAVSLAIARRRLRYETWYVTHLFVYAVVALAFFHQLSIGSDLLASAAFRFYWYALYVFILGNFLWFRWGRQLWRLCRHGFTVERVVRESPDASSFYITGRGMQKLAIHAGQFVIVRFLTAGLWWQAHPFSVSSVFDGGHIRITIKDKGDFTRAVQSLQPGVKVMLDGPLGSMTARRSRHHKVLLLAGGVGITPIRALAEAFAGQGKDIAVLYGSRYPADILFKNELDDLSRRFGARVHYIISRDPEWSGLRGRIDAEKISLLVPDFREREVFLCGPEEMMASARSALRSLGSRQPIHFERFSFA